MLYSLTEIFNFGLRYGGWDCRHGILWMVWGSGGDGGNRRSRTTCRRSSY